MPRTLKPSQSMWSVLWQVIILNFSANENSSATANASVKAQLPTSQNSAAFDLLGLNTGTNSSSTKILGSPSSAPKIQPSSTNQTSTELTSNLDLLCIGGGIFDKLPYIFGLNQIILLQSLKPNYYLYNQIL